MILAESLAKSQLPRPQAWNENWKLVDALAQDVQDFHIETALGIQGESSKL